MTVIVPSVIEESGAAAQLDSKTGCYAAPPAAQQFIPSASPRVSRLRNEVARVRNESNLSWRMRPSVGTWLAKAPVKMPAAAVAQGYVPPVLSIAPPAGGIAPPVGGIAPPAGLCIAPLAGASVNVTKDATFNAGGLSELTKQVSNNDGDAKPVSLDDPNEIVPSPVLSKSNVPASDDDAMFRTEPLPAMEATSGIAPAAGIAPPAGIAPAAGIAPPAGIAPVAGIAPPAAIAPPAIVPIASSAPPRGMWSTPI